MRRSVNAYVFSDIVMPGQMMGYDVAERIRSKRPITPNPQSPDRNGVAEPTLASVGSNRPRLVDSLASAQVLDPALLVARANYKPGDEGEGLHRRILSPNFVS